MEQRLRRDTAAIDAHAARVRFRIDKSDAEAEVRRIERGCVPAGAGAHHHELS